jgi:hypothetical protein
MLRPSSAPLPIESEFLEVVANATHGLLDRVPFAIELASERRLGHARRQTACDRLVELRQPGHGQAKIITQAEVLCATWFVTNVGAVLSDAEFTQVLIKVFLFAVAPPCKRRSKSVALEGR